MNMFDHEEQNTAEKIVIERKQASRGVALLMVLGCFVFLSGYFWGKKSAVQELVESTHSQSIADSMYTAVCGMYEKDDTSDERMSSPVVAQQEAVTTEIACDDHETQNTNASSKKYYAQLVGFGSQRHAERFVDKLASQGITTMLNKRSSKNSSGRVVNWYQVVTEQFGNKQELQSHVDMLCAREKLHDVRIVEVTQQA